MIRFQAIGQAAQRVLKPACIGAALLASASAAQARDEIKCIFPFWFGNAPIFVAQAEGYFDSEGLDVTTAFDNDRANVLPAMASGAIDCTIRTLGEEMSRPRRADTTGKVIGTIDISVGADGVVAPGDIQTVADLIGKKFAGEINHPGTVLVAHALNEMGLDFSDVDVQLIATDDAAAVFEDTSVAAVATWEPMMSSIVSGTSRDGAHILLSSADYEGLITDVIVVRTEDFEANPAKYAAFLRGIYRAIDLYISDPGRFVEIAAPAFDVPAAEMKEALVGVKFTSYEEAVAYMPSAAEPGKLAEIFDAFNEINVELDLQDAPLAYDSLVDGSLLNGLFDGKVR
ncbi:MAG: ABC transporter substrate-binding protein [Proteobacteria bacterium]|nr:ABC transporter substrate-binding protein [Pseudomonadota bacterium]